MKQKEKHIKELYRAFCLLKNEDEARRFLIDICTPAEINALAERLAIACALDQGERSYRDIASDIGASTTTVARVARFLNQENYQGYKLIFSRMKNNL